MSLICSLLFIALLAFVPFCFSIDQFRCKAVPGCEIARCNPTPLGRANLQRNEFPISCVSNDASQEKVSDDEVKKLKVAMEDLASDLKRLWDVNELQNDNMRTMREQLDQRTKEITKLLKKTKHLEKDATASQITVKVLQEKVETLENKLETLQTEHKEIFEENKKLENDLTTTQKTVTELGEKNQDLKNDLAATKKNVTELQEKNKNIENELKTLKEKNKEVLTTLTPPASTISVNNLKQNEEDVTAKSCRDVKIGGAKKRTKSGGVFDIYVEEIGKKIEVSCDLTTDGGGWTVFQRRMDGSEDFYRGWDDYVKGFGRKDKEFWMGLENIHQMTKNGKYELRVDLGAFDGNTTYAKYRSFSIGSSAVNYRLNVGKYFGTAGDSLLVHNGKPFTTKDKDNDGRDGGNCAVNRHGAWWYRGCGWSSLNSQYHDTVSYGSDGMRWWHWKRTEYLKSTEIKFRRAE